MKKIATILILITLAFLNCKNEKQMNTDKKEDTFKYIIDEFGDKRILRYKVPGFEDLPLQQKELVYYLSQAALCGRDILFDQFYKHNLAIRRTLEAIYLNYKGDRSTDNWIEFETYLKQIWFSNGIHHHYSTDKIKPNFTEEYFNELLNSINDSLIPLSKESITKNLIPVIFVDSIDSKRVNLNPELGLIEGSASNFYENVNTNEFEDYLKKIKNPEDETPVEYIHNSKTVKENGAIVEKVWKIGGMYSQAIEKIVFWLEKAATVAETENQKDVINKLIEVYKTGDLEKWDEYSSAWAVQNDSRTDFINGFIEVYGDPMGLKGTWESVVNFKDTAATKITSLLGENAQWFEDNSPTDKKFKKEKVKGVSAKVITVAQLGGDCYPSTPIGINLPNSNWIRAHVGSKSVTISNIINAYHMASLKSGMLDEFAFSEKEKDNAKKYGELVTSLHVDLHECLGHGSGKLLQGIKGDELKNYGNTIEEARADLFALYFGTDEKMVELGLLPNIEAGYTEYDSYIRGGLMTQLTRIKLGDNIEEAHMRNRQLIAKWAYENGKRDNVIEKKKRDGKTFFVVNDYKKLRELFGTLLAEIQRIKSEGDFEAAKELVEKYGVKIDQELHAEVLERYEKLKIPPYSGFVNPIFTPIEENGKIVDVKISYVDSYADQMINYSKNYSYLPTYP